MNTRRKSTLFLVEQLVVIAVFALCAIACISILTASYFMVKDSNDTANALAEAQNFIESLKADALQGKLFSATDREESPGLIEKSFHIETTKYYDSGWHPMLTNDKENAQFVLTWAGSGTMQPGSEWIYFDGTVTVSKTTGENLVSLPAAVIEKR